MYIAVWASVVLVGADFGATYLMRARAAKPQQEASASETRKIHELNVPIIRDGAVKGYVVVQLSYIVDLAVAAKLSVPPEPFVTDETFQYIYGDEKIDFAHLDKLDLGKMTETLVMRVNARMRANVITEMGVIECSFLVNAEHKDKDKS